MVESSHNLLVTTTSDVGLLLPTHLQGSVEVYSLPTHPILPSQLITSSPFISLSVHTGASLAVDMITIHGRMLVATGGSDYRVNVFEMKDGELELLWCEDDAHGG